MINYSNTPDGMGCLKTCWIAATSVMGEQPTAVITYHSV